MIIGRCRCSREKGGEKRMSIERERKGAKNEEVYGFSYACETLLYRTLLESWNCSYPKVIE